jgi:hypothetical protein
MRALRAGLSACSLLVIAACGAGAAPAETSAGKNNRSSDLELDVKKGWSPADENDPKTWVKRLDDPTQRAPAIKRLNALFDDAMTKANKNREAAGVKTLLDSIVEPLTKQYTSTPLDEHTRKELINFLGETADPRAAPAFAKALGDYEPGKNDEDVKFAAQAATRLANAGKLTDRALVDALWACFAKFRASKAKSINLLIGLHDAVLAVKHPSYAAKAVETLAQPVLNREDPDEILDKIQFWQRTSIQILGDLKYAAAAKPLVTVMLTPTKRDLGTTARAALMRMPKDAEPVLIAALKGTNPDLAKLAAAYPEKGHVPILAETLAYLSRPAGRDAVLEALAAADTDATRTLIALNLGHFPSEKKTTDAFAAAYAKVSAEATIPGYGNARSVFASASTLFYDPKMVDWLLKEIGTAKGEMLAEFPLSALPAASKLMTKDREAAVGAALDKAPLAKGEKDKFNLTFKAASAVLDKCDKDVACYLKKLDEPIPSSPIPAKMGHVKACYMAAIYGSPATAKELLGKVDKIKDGMVRTALVEAIDHLAPQGDAASAAELEKIVEADIASGSNANQQGDDALVKVALKLRSRATP